MEVTSYIYLISIIVFPLAFMLLIYSVKWSLEPKHNFNLRTQLSNNYKLKSIIYLFSLIGLLGLYFYLPEYNKHFIIIFVLLFINRKAILDD